jgi:hypothetical protein
VKEEEPEPEPIPMFRVFDSSSSGDFKRENVFEFEKESS